MINELQIKQSVPGLNKGLSSNLAKNYNHVKFTEELM